MGWFQTTYSVRFNRRHRRSGHLYQGLFKAHLVEADGCARQLVKEIRWRRRADGDEVSRLIASLVAQEADRRVAIWLRVRVGGQRITELAKEWKRRLRGAFSANRSFIRHLPRRKTTPNPLPARAVYGKLLTQTKTVIRSDLRGHRAWKRTNSFSACSAHSRSGCSNWQSCRRWASVRCGR